MEIAEEKIAGLAGRAMAVETLRLGRCRPHRHADALEFVYCLEGEMHVVAGHQRAALTGGDLLSIDMDDTHCLWSEEGGTALILHIDMKAVRQDWERTRYIYFAYDSQDLRPYQREAFAEVRFLLLTAARLLLAGEAGISVVQKIADEATDLLVDYFDWFNFHETYLETSAELKDRYHRIVTYCQRHFRDKVTIRGLAEAEHIHENYLSQYLRRGAFKSFSHMMNYIRCFESEKLLLNTALPVSEISFRCGFSDPKYYYKHFGLWWGTTPLKHRRWYEAYSENEMHRCSLSANESLRLVEREMVNACIAHTLTQAPLRHGLRSK
jgi:AraC-like DNA-binding protein/mannose-6-phosphate isomerase-like protein (cupin superfamily)